MCVYIYIFFKNQSQLSQLLVLPVTASCNRVSDGGNGAAELSAEFTKED